MTICFIYNFNVLAYIFLAVGVGGFCLLSTLLLKNTFICKGIWWTAPCGLSLLPFLFFDELDISNPFLKILAFILMIILTIICILLGLIGYIMVIFLSIIMYPVALIRNMHKGFNNIKDLFDIKKIIIEAKNSNNK